MQEDEVTVETCPECNVSFVDDHFCFAARYSVDEYRGIAWAPIRFELVEEYTDHNDEFGMVEDQNRIVMHMVGDDREFTFEVDQLTKLDDDEYCSCCGQIGCQWG